MEIWLSIALAALLLLGGNALNQLAARRHHGRLERLHNEALDLALELLQNLQKHRGLGAQQDAPSRLQRAVIALQLDRLWPSWPASERNLPALAAGWPSLREQPDDFSGHSQLIEQVLDAIHLLDVRLGQHHGPITAGLGEACRALEELARLRGLAVRAANHARCPPALQVQMRELCQRLAGPSCEPRIHQVIGQLERELIGADQVALAPTDCFALLTPIIDERLQGLRSSLNPHLAAAS